MDLSTHVDNLNTTVATIRTEVERLNVELTAL